MNKSISQFVKLEVDLRKVARELVRLDLDRQLALNIMDAAEVLKKRLLHQINKSKTHSKLELE